MIPGDDEEDHAANRARADDRREHDHDGRHNDNPQTPVTNSMFRGITTA